MNSVEQLFVRTKSQLPVPGHRPEQCSCENRCLEGDAHVATDALVCPSRASSTRRFAAKKIEATFREGDLERQQVGIF